MQYFIVRLEGPQAPESPLKLEFKRKVENRWFPDFFHWFSWFAFFWVRPAQKDTLFVWQLYPSRNRATLKKKIIFNKNPGFFKNKNLPEKGDGCKLKSILGSKIFLPEILRPFHPELHPPPERSRKIPAWLLATNLYQQNSPWVTKKKTAQTLEECWKAGKGEETHSYSPIWYVVSLPD